MTVAVRVLFLTTGDVTQASARFRVYQFLPHFEKYGNIEIVDVIPINLSMSPIGIAKALFSIVNKARKSDILFIQKARLPVPFLRGLTSLRKIVYDFDDAVFLPPPTWPAGRDFGSRRQRLNYTLSHADVVIAGNNYLADYARQYSEDVVIIPTVVDAGQKSLDTSYFSRWQFSRQVFQPADSEKPTPDSSAPVVVGWIGGPAHVRLLDTIGPTLRSLQKKYGIRIKVVSSREWNFPDIQVINKRWRLEDEVADVQSFDIGLMPLDANDPFLKGKCGFKIIEYMAAGVPPIASSVGVNTEIIEHGINGFLVSDFSEWKGYLERLVQDQILMHKMVIAARHRAVEHYSISSVLPKHLSLFESLAS